MTTTVTGSVDAWAGHLGLATDLVTNYNGPFVSTFESMLSGVAEGGYSTTLDFGGSDPSFVRLTFLADASSFMSDGYFSTSYAVTVGGDPTWTFEEAINNHMPIHTYVRETFAVDPTAGSVLLSVSGQLFTHDVEEDVGRLHDASTLDLTGVEFLDEQGNVMAIPEPASICLVALGGIACVVVGKKYLVRN